MNKVQNSECGPYKNAVSPTILSKLRDNIDFSGLKERFFNWKERCIKGERLTPKEIEKGIEFLENALVHQTLDKCGESCIDWESMKDESVYQLIACFKTLLLNATLDEWTESTVVEVKKDGHHQDEVVKKEKRRDINGIEIWGEAGDIEGEDNRKIMCEGREVVSLWYLACLIEERFGDSLLKDELTTEVRYSFADDMADGSPCEILRKLSPRQLQKWLESRVAKFYRVKQPLPFMGTVRNDMTLEGDNEKMHLLINHETWIGLDEWYEQHRAVIPQRVMTEEQLRELFPRDSHYTEHGSLF